MVQINVIGFHCFEAAFKVLPKPCGIALMVFVAIIILSRTGDKAWSILASLSRYNWRYRKKLFLIKRICNTLTASPVCRRIIGIPPKPMAETFKPVC